MSRARVLVVVLARAPMPGRAKTRLVPRLGAWGAARLQARLIERSLRLAQRARLGAIELHGAPHARHPLLQRIARGVDASCHGQRGADLGARMHAAFVAGLRRGRAVILIGTDCPELRVRDLRQAARALMGGRRAVITPALDGGYVLIGLRRAEPRLFDSIAWGSDAVLAQTRDRLARLGWNARVLDARADLDRPEDLERSRRSWCQCVELPR